MTTISGPLSPAHFSMLFFYYYFIITADFRSVIWFCRYLGTTKSGHSFISETFFIIRICSESLSSIFITEAEEAI